MGSSEQTRRDRRMVGDRARATPLSAEERLRILRQLEGVRDRMEADSGGRGATHDRATGDDAATRREDERSHSEAERRAESRRERGTGGRGLTGVPRVLRGGLAPAISATATTSAAPSPRVGPQPSLGRTPDPTGVDPELGQRVDHTMGPDPGAAGRRAITAPNAPDLPPDARRSVARTQDALSELNSRYFRDLWNITAERLVEGSRSRHDAPLRRLRSRFERLMGRHPRGIPTREIWSEARELFDEAYERARARWSSSTMWSAVWRNEEATRRLEQLHERGVIRISRDSRGRPTGAPHIRQYDSRIGRYSWVPINIDHAVPLERNPWGVLGRGNLVATTPLVNQRFLSGFSEHSRFPMAVDRFGGAHGDLDDAIEDFVMANGLSRRQRATAAQLDARYGAAAAGSRRRRRYGSVDADEPPDESSSRRGGRRRTSESGRRVIRGLLPALSWALELLVGSGRQAIYRDAVEELRRQDRLRRRGRRDFRFSPYSVSPPNLQQTFERIISDRHPVAIHQLGELRQHFEQWLETWERTAGEEFIRRQAAVAVTPAQRDDILNDQLTDAIDSMRALQDVYAQIDRRLGEQDWESLAQEAEVAADNFDSLIEGELHEFAIDIEDAEYLSRAAFRRIANAFHNFFSQLTLLRGLVFDAIHRYRRLIDTISELTATE